jgi:hypothetical protein
MVCRHNFAHDIPGKRCKAAFCFRIGPEAQRFQQAPAEFDRKIRQPVAHHGAIDELIA